MPKKKHHPLDMGSLEKFAERIGSFHHYLVQDLSGQLFHYTDLNALRSIVENHDLRLTNARYSNDEQEMDHGYNIARKVINKRIKKSRSKKILAYLNQVATLVGKPPPEGV